MPLNSGWVGEKNSWRETRNKFPSFKFSLTYNKVISLFTHSQQQILKRKGTLTGKLHLEWNGGGDSTKQGGSHGHKN